LILESERQQRREFDNKRGVKEGEDRIQIIMLSLITKAMGEVGIFKTNSQSLIKTFLQRQKINNYFKKIGRCKSIKFSFKKITHQAVRAIHTSIAVNWSALNEISLKT
jgi:hypothetical protein